MTSRSRSVLAVLSAALGFSLVAAPATTAAGSDGQDGHRHFTPGAPGVGDAYFPYAGNGGYDVRHYDLRLRYRPPVDPTVPERRLHGRLRGVATIRLRATQDLSAFDLDLRGLDVRSVRVDGTRARFTQVQDDVHRRWEVVVHPRPKLRQGSQATVVVRYDGRTGRPVDVGGALYGWVTTADGAMVVNEPEAAMTWYPVSDHPTDKARYHYQVTVPRGTTAVANGLPGRAPVTRRGSTTWFWRAPDLQASYLSTVTIGDFVLRPTYRTAGGVPVIDAVDADVRGRDLATTNAGLAAQPRILDYFSSLFGPYPFVAAGGIVDDDTVDYALETQTRPVYSQVADEGTVAHDVAHQWLGDAVSPRRWQDIWLNEGWATYAEWLWSEHEGGRTARSQFREVMAVPAGDEFWELDVTDPGRDHLFDTPVYARGAAALHALRRLVGDDTFFAGVREYVRRFEGGTATTEDFIDVYEDLSGRNLDRFADRWLRDPVKPTA